MAEAEPHSLGASEPELARLDAQAASIATPTAFFLRSAGIAAGMRVLDLGTGLGHVAFQVSELVGSTGAVVGIDQAAAMLRVAEERRAAGGVENVRFVEADVRTFRDREAFDAVVGRLILFHLQDAVEVLRHHIGGLAQDGLMLNVSTSVRPVSRSSRPRWVPIVGFAPARLNASTTQSRARRRCQQPRAGDPREWNRDRRGTGPRLAPSAARS
jgi:2-polyprenyl-3-methyl-5-hydroxy-6-metoxy-1,4-benzoquinol methylase